MPFFKRLPWALATLFIQHTHAHTIKALQVWLMSCGTVRCDWSFRVIISITPAVWCTVCCYPLSLRSLSYAAMCVSHCHFLPFCYPPRSSHWRSMNHGFEVGWGLHLCLFMSGDAINTHINIVRSKRKRVKTVYWYVQCSFFALVLSSWCCYTVASLISDSVNVYKSSNARLDESILTHASL